ncbi:uncharacterized protein E0L32_011942 [Thyridium curvatum]|uniref:RED-like N-terminal domain-containing protein n=1 Tax=Thyridium curvatum TaxID=1093900 RepID=A0A507BGR9_9PEZI|nr:uncharacterized protein E0L32_011942 [Thyridium curvatum]TPX17974.1 hypothetical protein E0L32_011942 [Thyridium curvatum]
MNNDQFRKLVVGSGTKSPASAQDGMSPPPPSRGGSAAAALGSRQKSFVPMTPRSVMGGGGVNFAKQLAERNQANQKQKKFRTSAPRGSRLAEGYTDRSKATAEAEEDDRAERLKALEESFRKEEIDQTTYEKLRFEIAGGDLSSTHLVKGLDFKLLERIRKGEDVYAEKKAPSPTEEQEPEAENAPEEDVDDALERLEDTEVQAVERQKAQKKGQLATTSLVPGKKRTRDQILAEMKAAREAAKAKEESALGGKFKKIGAKKAAGSRIEYDSRGREVLIIVDEDGHEKRKVRKVNPDEAKERAAFVPDSQAEVLGMEVPEYYKQKQQREAEEAAAKEVDIFDDADDYDPLAGIDSGSDASDSEDEGAKSKAQASAEESHEGEDGEVVEEPASKGMPPPPRPQAGPASRNYFKDSKTGLASEESRAAPSMSDPAVLAALKKAKTLRAAEQSEEDKRKAEREERLKKLLESSNRDAEDMDMGFGSSRVEDEADLDDGDVKLSKWGGDKAGGESGGGGGKRKRGSKKRKGDGNNAEDVMRVLEQRRSKESSSH